MNRRSLLLGTHAARLLTSAAGLVLLFCVGCHRETDLYPEPPFEHVAEGFPEIIALSELPDVEDQEATDAYWDRRTEVFETSMNRTIMADAPQVERDLFEALEDTRYAVARKLADQILLENPDSLIGLYAIAQVEAFAEGDMAYALNSIRRARHHAEAMGRLNPRDPIGQEWYVRTLSTEWDILFAMERSEEVIMVVDRLEAVYAPLPWLKSFALIKLERFDEARAEIAKQKDLGQFEVDAHNSLLIIEDSLKSRKSSLQVAREMCERFPERRVLQYNLAQAALSNAKFGEAEQALLAAAKATDSPMNSTPYVPLASLFVQQGRFAEALDSLKLAQIDRGEREPYTLADDEASTNMAIASVLLAYNESDLAMRFARRAIETPDRAASTSVSAHDLRLSDGLNLWTIQKYECEELQEQLSFGSVPVPASLVAMTSLRFSMWATKQRFASDLNHEKLVDIVTPYQPSSAGSEIQSWHRFMLFDLVPLGVLEVALSEAQRNAKQPWIPPYLHALQAGIRLQKMDYAESLRLADNALDDLPPRAEKVFRAFVSAIAGQAAWELGQPDNAIGHWSTSLRDFPQVFRLLDIQIPIRLSHPGADIEQHVASTLSSSSRFFEDERGFEIRVRAVGDKQLIMEVFRNDQARHLELLVPITAEDGFAETTVDQFHQEFFQPLVELTQADLGSLDGSPVAARMRREVEQLFSDFIVVEEPSEESEAEQAVVE